MGRNRRSLPRAEVIRVGRARSVELAVVIAIIGILAAVALPRLADVGDEAEKTVVRDYLQKLQSAYGLYMLENGTPPSSSTGTMPSQWRRSSSTGCGNRERLLTHRITSRPWSELCSRT